MRLARGMALCATGGPRIHLKRRQTDDRALCGLEIRGPQPEQAARVTCFTCMKRIRDVERPPATRDTVPVWVNKSAQVHLASRVMPPLFCAAETLCGRQVGALLALGPGGVSCPRCIELAKASA